MRARIVAGLEFHKKAMEALLQDCMKKKSETAKNLVVKRALKRARMDDGRGDEDREGSDEIEDQGTTVAIWLADPSVVGHRDANNNWIWNERARRKLVVVHLRTLDGIAVVVYPYLPVGRNIREILGALEDPDPAAPTIPPDWTHLRTDAEVVAFLQMTESKPIRLLVVLHRATRGPPNTPPPNPLESYFPVDKFEPPDEYDDPAEDSNAAMHNIAGVA